MKSFTFIRTSVRFLLLCALLGCSQPARRPDATPSPTSPSPAPNDSPRATLQRGRASWYGRAFQNRRTASGERFDFRELTAAHRTLPFGAEVQVCARASGLCVRVRINDRGPARKDRIIDLSYAAAREIGIHRLGTGEVELRRLAR